MAGGRGQRGGAGYSRQEGKWQGSLGPKHAEQEGGQTLREDQGALTPGVLSQRPVEQTTGVLEWSEAGHLTREPLSAGVYKATH